MNPQQTPDNEVARLRAEVQRVIEDRNRIGIEIRGEYLPKLKEQANEVARLREELKKARKRIKELTPCGCDNYLQITCKKHSK